MQEAKKKETDFAPFFEQLSNSLDRNGNNALHYLARGGSCSQPTTNKTQILELLLAPPSHSLNEAKASALPPASKAMRIA